MDFVFAGASVALTAVVGWTHGAYSLLSLSLPPSGAPVAPAGLSSPHEDSAHYVLQHNFLILFF